MKKIKDLSKKTNQLCKKIPTKMSNKTLAVITQKWYFVGLPPLFSRHGKSHKIALNLGLFKKSLTL